MEVNDGGGVAWRKPGESECMIKARSAFGLRRENPGGGKAWIVDKRCVVIARPMDGIWWIGNDQLKRLVIPMLRMRKATSHEMLNLVETDIV